ncbi:MAG: replication-relaxation family protein [Chloroflexi bacterium]|nr:replication-relaxation family protein [Chloroflexota bacterium]
MSDKRTYLPRHVRAEPEKRPPMALTERDIALLKTVADFRVMTTQQLENLFFNSRSTAQYRLQRLFQHEYLERQFLSVVGAAPTGSQTLYTLGERGAVIVARDTDTDPRDVYRPKRGVYAWKFIEHTLAINDFRTAVSVAAVHNGFHIEEWLDEFSFRASPDYVEIRGAGNRVTRKPVYPDAYFCLVTPRGRTRFFLELDRGVEPRARLKPQFAVYEAYTAGELYQQRFQARSLRILVVTTSPQRLASLKHVVTDVGGDRKYWFTTMSLATPESVLSAPIWEQLGDSEKQALIS